MNDSCTRPHRPHIAIAALSSRSLVTQAAAEGFVPHALDLFGDADTRAAATWRAIGATGHLAIDAERLHDALHALAAAGDCLGWIAGSGFEMQLDLLASAAHVLPLIGNSPEVVRKSRSPGFLYPLLAELGVPHPETRVSPPPRGEGWLLKNAHACGGWHVRRAPTETGRPLPAGAYFQREADGKPMSALFLGDGRAATVLGVAQQRVRPLGRRRWVFHGGIGPVQVPAGVRMRIAAFADRLTDALGLVGLNGIDFMLDGDAPSVLELNARPTAALSLFANAVPTGLLQAHVATCRGAPVSRFATVPTQPRAFEVVFARTPGRVDAALHDALRRAGWCADVPMNGTVLDRGDPMCTVLVEAQSLAEAEACLAARVAQVRGWMAESLETTLTGTPAVSAAVERGADDAC